MAQKNGVLSAAKNEEACCDVALLLLVEVLGIKLLYLMLCEFRYYLEKIFFNFSISSETWHFVTATVAAFELSPNGLSHNVTTRF